MWLGDPQQYRHYDQLELLMQCMLDDYAAWNEKYDIDKVGVDARLRYRAPRDNARGLMTLPLIDARTIQKRWAQGWDRTLEQVFNCPGMVDMCINFIRPGKMLPVHDDRKVWAYIEESMQRPVVGYTVSFGVHIPEPEKQCLVFDGEEKIWSTGEFRAFDGRHVEHYMHNRSSDWRITAMVDIEREFWDI